MMLQSWCPPQVQTYHLVPEVATPKQPLSDLNILVLKVKLWRASVDGICDSHVLN
jgi:hypothetical protein